MPTKTPAQYLSECRINAKRSQADAAATIGVHVQSWSNWERGVAPIPPEHIYKLNKVGVDRGALVSLIVEDYRARLVKIVKRAGGAK